MSGTASFATTVQAFGHNTGIVVPREVVVPDDLAAALDADPPLRAFFEALPNSLQRFHVDTVEGAKTEATRQRRVDKALLLFREGKKR